jgi:hypothetical protein
MGDFGFDELITREVICERCGLPGLYSLDTEKGDFAYQCACCKVTISAIHVASDGPSAHLRLIRSNFRRPGPMLWWLGRSRIRSSDGAIWREVWRERRGSEFRVIYQVDRPGGVTEFGGCLFERTNPVPAHFLPTSSKPVLPISAAKRFLNRQSRRMNELARMLYLTRSAATPNGAHQSDHRQ